jgi:hypothetical protein
MKYYKKNNEVYAFEQDGSQDNLITPYMVVMSKEEIDRHINPDKYLTPSEIYARYIKSLRPLSRRQFKLILLENDLLTEVESRINAISDIREKTKVQIEYVEATEFRRDSESLSYMCNLLGLTEQQINTMWEHALTL